MSSFLQRQGQLILNKEHYAFLMTGIMVFIPFANWLSLVILALVTLRKGAYQGCRVLIIGLTASIIVMRFHYTLPHTEYVIVATYLGCYGAALVLRTSANWQMVMNVLLLIAIFSLVLLHYLVPHIILQELQDILKVFNNFQDIDVIMKFLHNPDANRLNLLANYFLGIKVLSIILCVLLTLGTARYIQSLLFYPGGFRKELLNFRASKLAVFLLMCSVVGVYCNQALSISCVPLLSVCVMIAGICLFFNIIMRKRDWLTLLLLFVPLVLVPYVMLPIYVLFGSLDSIFNLRIRLLQKASNSK